ISVILIAAAVCFFSFFFSSRRRHTRSDRDWSSDVCSSDLRSAARLLLPAVPAAAHPPAPLAPPPSPIPGSRSRPLPPPPSRTQRSEERRVGKECRYRWWVYG